MEKPTRNKNRFILFSIETRSKLKGRTRLNSNQMMEKLAELWRKLPEDEKAKYNDAATRDKARYVEECRIFSLKYPDQPLENKTKRNHIKKAVSGYGLFLKNMKTVVRRQVVGIKMADVIKIVASRWKDLCPIEADYYNNLSKLEKELTRGRGSERTERSTSRNSRLGRVSTTQDIPKPSKKVKGAQGTPNTLIYTQTEVVEQMKNDMIDASWTYDPREPITEDFAFIALQNDWGFGCETPNKMTPTEGLFFDEDDELFSTGLKLSKKRSVFNFGLNDDFLSQRVDHYFNLEADLFENTSNSQSEDRFINFYD